MRHTAVAVVLLALSGVVHGVWTHRWEATSTSEAQARAERIEQIPLRVGEWEGERKETDQSTLPEEVVGRGVTVLYTSRIDGSTVTVYLACGPTEGLIAHTPRVCYPANGYTCPTRDLRVQLPAEGVPGEYWVSNFTNPNAATPTHLRVFWSWSDGSGWQLPNNPGRTFRRAAVLYKCYAIRQVTTPDEPIEGDPALRLLAALVPQLDATLAPAK